MVGIFQGNHEILIVGLDKDNNPLDPQGTTFGENSGRDIKDYERFDVDLSKGALIEIPTNYQVWA